MLRILAPYTAYCGKAYKLHLFEITDGKVSHHPVQQETAYTLYVQGIAIVGSDLDIEAVSARIRALADSHTPLADICTDIATICTTSEACTAYAATFPFQSLQRITEKK